MPGLSLTIPTHPPRAPSSTASVPARPRPSSALRYANVKGKLNTGPNLRKVAESYQGTGGPNALRKPTDSYFGRIKPMSLAGLVEPSMEEEESIYKLDADDVASVVSSVWLKDAEPPAGGHGNLLILDLRSFDEFEKCHVYGAMHYEKASLHKATNVFPRELYFYKGRADSNKLIALCDEDGKGLGEAANLFVEKGVENTYVLAGGFHGVCSRCPHILHPAPPNSAHTTLAAGLATKSVGPRGARRAPLSENGGRAMSHRTQSTMISNASSKRLAGPWRN